MPILSLCSKTGANVGPVSCDTRRAAPAVIILGGKAFSPAEYANNAAYEAALLEAINLENGNSEKMYPFPEIQNTVNNTEANTEGTTGSGFKMILREGKPVYTFGVIVGTNLEKQMRKFNNKIVPVTVFDKNKNSWGKLDIDKNFVGTDALIYVSPKPYSDGNSVDTEYTLVTVSFLSMADFADDAAFVPTTFSISNLEGLLDAKLRVISNASNVYKIAVEFENAQLGGNVNFYDKYATELASAALWRSFTGAALATPLTITSVAADAALKAFTVTLDTTAYAALSAGAKILLDLETPPVLLAAAVRGIEGDPVIITKA